MYSLTPSLIIVTCVSRDIKIDLHDTVRVVISYTNMEPYNMRNFIAFTEYRKSETLVLLIEQRDFNQYVT